MIKSKIVKKKEQVYIEIKTEKGQQINEPELQTLKTEMQGLLPLTVEPKMKKFKISYNVTGYIPFKDYLKMALTSESLARLLRSILTTLQDVERLYLKQDCILFDAERIYINAMQQSVNFIYIPIRFYETGTRLRDFLLSIVEYGTFDKNEDNTYFKEYIRILNEGLNFSVFDLEEYVKRLENNDFQESNKQIQCTHCKTLLAEKTKFCPVCGTKVDMSANTVRDDIYNPIEHIDKSEFVHKEENRESRVNNGTQGLSDETTLLGVPVSSEPPTMMLAQRDFFTEHNPYLIRIKTEERILIQMNDFKIGKRSGENDYVVTNNQAVSGKHAEIFVEDDVVYIKDRGSLNGTFVNGKRLAKDEERKLVNNDKVKLADEEFIFSVEN